MSVLIMIGIADSHDPPRNPYILLSLPDFTTCFTVLSFEAPNSPEAIISLQKRSRLH